MSRRLPALAALALTAALAACGGDSGPADATVAVEGTKDACTADLTSVAAGTIAFDFRNTSGQVSELYVMTADDKIKKEVENVGDGTTRTMKVNLSAGAYKLVCKPGEKGDGISTAFTVTG